MDYRLPRPHFQAFIVWRRSFLVWIKLIKPAIALHFGEPLIYFFGLGLGLAPFIGDVNDMSYLTFLAAGLMAASSMMTATLEGTYSVFTRMVPQNTYEALLATPTDVDDMVAGEFLWCASKALFSGVIIFIVAAALGAIETWSALWVIPVIFLSALAFSGPAIVIASFSPGYDFFNYYLTLAITPMFILCGVFYPVSALPEWVQDVLIFLPLTHAIELIRPIVAGTEIQNATLNVSVLLGYIGVFYYLATIFVRRRMIV